MAISQNNLRINYLYQLATEEGEGFGTAYEYFVKIKLLLGLLGKNRVRRILMAGFPEKYGFSLDVFFLAKLCGSKILAVDTESKRLNDAERLIETLDSKKILSRESVEFREIGNFQEMRSLGDFDLSVSPSVIQRLPVAERPDYIHRLFNTSRSAIIFAPNRGNNAHENITKLNSLTMSEVKGWERLISPEMHHRRCGFLDLPPFPPGIKVNRALISRRSLSIEIGAKALEFWAASEKLFPYFMKNRMAHIVYLFASRSIDE